MAKRRCVLEQDFLTESRVFMGLFGNTYCAQMEWARSVMSPEDAALYIDSWWQGRQTSLLYLRWLAERVRKEAGSDAGGWLESFTSTSAAILKRMEGTGVGAPGAAAR